LGSARFDLGTKRQSHAANQSRHITKMQTTALNYRATHQKFLPAARGFKISEMIYWRWIPDGGYDGENRSISQKISTSKHAKSIQQFSFTRGKL
jgi:hypothetical protein